MLRGTILPGPGDYIELVKGDLINIGEAFDEQEIILQTKKQLKNHIWIPFSRRIQMGEFE